MTNRTDLDKCSAQIELVKQLLGPETFDLKKILIELETKKKLLITFKPRDYITILKDLELGAIIHPGDWVEEEKEIEVDKTGMSIQKDGLLHQDPIPEPIVEIPLPEPEVDPKEAEVQRLKDKLAELQALKELEKEEDAEIIPEVIE